MDRSEQFFFQQLLANMMGTTSDRAEIAIRLLNGLQSRRLITPEEEGELIELVRLTLSADHDDVGIALQVIERGEHPGRSTSGPVAGAIMAAAVRTAAAILESREQAGRGRPGPQFERGPGSGGGNDTLPGSGVPRQPASIAASSLYLGIVAAAVGSLAGPEGAAVGFIAGAVVGAIVGAYENGDFGGDSGGGDGSGGCFTAGTSVLMADGSRKAIDAIDVGDMVIARNEKTLATAPCRVTHAFHHPAEKLLRLRLRGGEVIETTAAHRFATSDGEFLQAARLPAGARLATTSAQEAVVLGAEPSPDEAPVFNLAVQDFHTYFVGEAGLWVHNVKDPFQPD